MGLRLTFPRPEIVHVAMVVSMAPNGVALRWRNATIDTTIATSKVARTRERGRSRVRVRARSPCPLRTLCGSTYGLSRLTTVSRNRCSTGLSCTSHVVPQLMTKQKRHHINTTTSLAVTSGGSTYLPKGRSLSCRPARIFAWYGRKVTAVQKTHVRITCIRMPTLGK